jgi:hypothetical protein
MIAVGFLLFLFVELRNRLNRSTTKLGIILFFENRLTAHSKGTPYNISI